MSRAAKRQAVSAAAIIAVAAAVTIGGFALPACPPSTPSAPVQLSMHFRFRSDCGPQAFNYDTACMAAIDVRVLDAATRTPIDGLDQCRPTTGVNTIGELLEGAPIIDLGGLSTTRTVIFELRAIQNKAPGPDDPCQSPETFARWLFWGKSDAVDLSAYASLDGGPSPIIDVHIDCRDCTFACGADAGSTCFGCTGIGLPGCELALPSSYCVPANPAVNCQKTCDDDEECFEGARACVDGICDTTTVNGGLCSPCAGVQHLACAEGFACVTVAGSAPFCAFPCPQGDCVSGTKCNREHNDLEVVPP